MMNTDLDSDFMYTSRHKLEVIAECAEWYLQTVDTTLYAYECGNYFAREEIRVTKDAARESLREALKF